MMMSPSFRPTISTLDSSGRLRGICSFLFPITVTYTFSSIFRKESRWETLALKPTWSECAVQLPLRSRFCSCAVFVLFCFVLLLLLLPMPRSHSRSWKYISLNFNLFSVASAISKGCCFGHFSIHSGRSLFPFAFLVPPLRFY